MELARSSGWQGVEAEATAGQFRAFSGRHAEECGGERGQVKRRLHGELQLGRGSGGKTSEGKVMPSSARRASEALRVEWRAVT